MYKVENHFFPVSMSLESLVFQLGFNLMTLIRLDEPILIPGDPKRIDPTDDLLGISYEIPIDVFHPRYGTVGTIFVCAFETEGKPRCIDMVTAWYDEEAATFNPEDELLTVKECLRLLSNETEERTETKPTAIAPMEKTMQEQDLQQFDTTFSTPLGRKSLFALVQESTRVISTRRCAPGQLHLWAVDDPHPDPNQPHNAKIVIYGRLSSNSDGKGTTTQLSWDDWPSLRDIIVLTLIDATPARSAAWSGPLHISASCYNTSVVESFLKIVSTLRDYDKDSMRWFINSPFSKGKEHAGTNNQHRTPDAELNAAYVSLRKDAQFSTVLTAYQKHQANNDLPKKPRVQDLILFNTIFDDWFKSQKERDSMLTQSDAQRLRSSFIKDMERRMSWEGTDKEIHETWEETQED